MPDSLIRVIDDDAAYRVALERSLRGLSGCEVSGYPRAGDFLDSLDPQRPGCVITDLLMPGMDGLQLQKALNRRGVCLPLIFITGHGETHKAVAALKAGAVDFIEKPFSEQVLVDSVRQALARDADQRRLADEHAIVEQRFGNLTPRERQVFALVVSDLTNKEIARRLCISPRTVEHHREHIMLKMQAASASELITMAMICGIRELRL